MPSALLASIRGIRSRSPTPAADLFWLTGSEGDDSIAVGENDDPLNGGGGNDRFTMAGNLGDASGDELTGGADIDRADYTGCDTAVTVTIDGTNNDGGTCGNGSAATDDVHTDVESITGSNTATDTLTGSCAANTIAGDSGTVDGAGAADTINGDPARLRAQRRRLPRWRGRERLVQLRRDRRHAGL